MGSLPQAHGSSWGDGCLGRAVASHSPGPWARARSTFKVTGPRAQLPGERRAGADIVEARGLEGCGTKEKGVDCVMGDRVRGPSWGCGWRTGLPGS